MNKTLFETSVQFKPKYVEPAGDFYQAVDFDLDQVCANVDGERPAPEVNTFVDVTEIFKRFLAWISECKAADARAIIQNASATLKRLTAPGAMTARSSAQNPSQTPLTGLFGLEIVPGML
jgi:hypothetical protein